MKLLLMSDGASRGNPGHAGAGAVLRDETGTVVGEVCRYLGVTTNNQAEYQALLLGIAEASRLGGTTLDIALDSELLVRQLNGQYRVRAPHLLPLYESAKCQLAGFAAVRVRHIPRELNTHADLLSNRAIDERFLRRVDPPAPAGGA